MKDKRTDVARSIPAAFSKSSLMHSARKKMTILLGVLSFSFFGCLAFQHVERQGLIRAAESVCSRIDSEYVRANEEKSKAFVQLCFEESEHDVDLAMGGLYGPDARRALMSILNDRLSALRVSHLQTFAPDETYAAWGGEAVDTGARARLVDGEIVVTRTIEGSPAARAGVEPGDLIVAIDGVPLADAPDAERLSGVWEILRPDETRVSVPIEAVQLRDPIIPYWTHSDSASGIRVLKIPSFLPQAVDNDEWPLIKDQITRMPSRSHLILDLRGNPGGSFPAMLRILGTLKCDRGLIGWIYRGAPPESSRASQMDIFTYEMQDSLAAEPQLELLEKNGSIPLAPFKVDSCFAGHIGVLIDQGTSSVAEIFAQSLKERPRTTIAGWRTSGHVVMARWFQIAGLSEDYTVSIPVALYRSAKGEELEGHGVSPDQLLTDKLARWRSKQDPWIKDLARRIVSE